MSFGGGFGGFGSTNNNNQSTGFGGFGSSNNNNTSGFGSNTNTGSSIFGGANNSGTTGSTMFGGASSSSPFGGGGGFGANNTNNTAFGSKPFGSSTTGGGLFGGGGGATGGGSAFGGFGSTNNTTTTSAFGSNTASTGGGLFGQNKPATGFGASSTGGGGLFGGGSTGGGFGSTNTNTTTGGFGANTGGAFGGGSNPPANNGTANTPFQAFSEKDGASGNAQYQTITFQQPYQNYSLEELRVADYNQGRRYGNNNGQAGAFGQSTGFGGFGSNNNNNTTTASTGFGGANTNTGGGLFGGGNTTTNTTSAFGQNTGSAFGTNNNTSTGGGLFGQAKPATGGLFGSTNNTSTGTTGGLFGGGSTSNTTGGFGSGGGGFGSSTTGGGGLFGQNKPATGGGLFGGGAATNNTSTPFGGGTTNTGGAFGQSNTGGGGLFGQSNNQASSTPAFGASNTTSNTGGGLFGGGGATGGGFGQNNQTSTQNTTSGGLFGGGGGGFGQNNQQNQQKSGGLFGGASTGATGGGLFGGQSNQSQPASGGLFGGAATNNNNNSTGGGLFGQKPATGGSSLFGGAASTTNTGSTGGGLFGGLGGQNNQQNNGGSSLFGGQNNNQQKPGGLFGGSTNNTNTGGGLFGGGLGQQNNQQSTLGGSLFSSQNQQPQQQQQNNNSLFGASGSSLLNTSMNTNPYGNDALFAGLATPSQSPGPIATPLSSSQKNKKNPILPQHKLNPAASTRLLTPQTKRGGYGFSYSTYGSPANGASQAGNPNFSGSLFANRGLSQSLSKSVSASNLRNSFTPDTSILSPGAFSTTGRNFGNGSLKRLNINRNINAGRTPLFDEPAQKRVSFAAGDSMNGDTNGETAMVVRQDEEDSSPRAGNHDAGRETSRTDMQQVNGNELARVSEDHVLTPKSSSSVNIQPGQDPKPGEYWCSPSIDQLRKMSKQELRSVPNFVVGRQHIGEIKFNHGEPVDLSEVDLNKLFGDIVQLNPRNATVYGETCTCLPKPPLGSALNRPSEIVLGNSWPRNKAGKKDVKHLERLKRVAGTTFVKYNQSTGEWTFTVPHFSSYGLDYDDYSDDEDEDASSELSDVPDTPVDQQHRSSQMTSTPQDDSFASPTQSSPDDTFDFKKGFRGRASVPGGFGDDTMYEDDEDVQDTRGESFLGRRSVGSLDGQQDADYSESESGLAHDQSMAGSVSSPVQTTEQTPAKEDTFKSTLMPKSILKAGQFLKPATGTPSKAQPVFDDDWANQLQRTISPKKQDRQALRESQGHVLREQETQPTKLSQSVRGRQMTTAMDLMDSLFGEPEQQQQQFPQRVGHGIELPYSKRPKKASDLDQLSDVDKDFHSCSKPRFSEANILIYGSKGPAHLEGGVFPTAHEPLVGATKDVRFAKMPTFTDSSPETLSLQKQHTRIYTPDGIPSAKLLTDPAPVEFSSMAKTVALDTTTGVQEQQAWQLLSLLYDDADRVPADIHVEDMKVYRKEKLSEFWKLLVWEDAQKHAQQATSPEERALAQLSCNNVPDACHTLLDGLDCRLATMVAQIGGDEMMRQSIATQIEEWRRLDTLSEMEDAHRALYELLSGNCIQAEGKTGAGRENRASTFNISSRFGLDWRRAFGLRLWYGTLVNEPIEMAVAQFADAVRDGREDVKPVPWFVQDNADMGWNDSAAEHREDLLWGILKLYASAKMDLPANIENVLAPENVSGNPFNARLSFQLFQLFKSRQEDASEADERKVAMPTARGDDEGEDKFRRSLQSWTAPGAEDDEQAADPLVELGDKITLTYAASLHTPEHWTTAIWVYSHLSSAPMREHYMRSLVNQFIGSFSLEDGNPTYAHVTGDLHVPATWLHAAAALHAKSNGDALREATHLIKAEELEEAHEVLCRKVGPEAIISRDYDALRELMAGFVAESSVPLPREPVQGWAQGGQIYFDYIELIDLTGQRSTYRVDEDLDARVEELLTKLQRALEIAGRDRLGACGLEERVALMEIAGTVANLITKTPRTNRNSILKLPLTEDLWLKHSIDLSTSYYRNILVSSR